MKKDTLHTDKPLRFSPYQKYRDSGVEWLGKIPAHWELKRLKYLAPISDERHFEQNRDQLYIGLEHIESGTGKLLANSITEQVESIASTFRPGDVLFGKLRPYLAKVLLPEFEGICSTELLVLRSHRIIHPKILFYQLLCEDLIRWINSMTFGTKMPRADPAQISNIYIAFGSNADQRSIFSFLDRETAKIDALVEKKEKLIELLQEKRAALITQAVTKGLDPSVPLKDSGVEWLGKIPANWKIKRLKYLTTINDETLKEYTDPNLEILYVDIANVDSAKGITDKDKIVFEKAPSRARRVVRNGDVIVSTVRTYLRAIAPIQNAEPNLIVSTGFAVIRPREIHASFASYSFRSNYFVDQVVSNSFGVSYPAINESELACFNIAYPAEKEQHAIADFLDRETAKIDALAEKIQKGIDLLKEYRSALISAAVTGKIDVRNAVRE